jgi:hypothetical protein
MVDRYLLCGRIVEKGSNLGSLTIQKYFFLYRACCRLAEKTDFELKPLGET